MYQVATMGLGADSSPIEPKNSVIPAGAFEKGSADCPVGYVHTRLQAVSGSRLPSVSYCVPTALPGPEAAVPGLVRKRRLSDWFFIAGAAGAVVGSVFLVIGQAVRYQNTKAGNV